MGEFELRLTSQAARDLREIIQSQIEDLLNTGNAILAELEKREQKPQ